MSCEADSAAVVYDIDITANHTTKQIVPSRSKMCQMRSSAACKTSGNWKGRRDNCHGVRDVITPHIVIVPASLKIGGVSPHRLENEDISRV